MNERVRNLLDMGRLVPEPSPDEEVLGLFDSAAEAYDDACLSNRSPRRRLIAAYDAGRLAALTLVRAANLRVRAQNHHEVTLAAAGFLAGGELEGLIQEFQALRLERIQIEYGWSARATEADVEKVLPGVRRILVLASSVVSGLRPAVGSGIRMPS